MIALARSKAAPASGLATAAATFAEAVRKLDFTIENERLRAIRAEIAKIDDVIAETSGALPSAAADGRRAGQGKAKADCRRFAIGRRFRRGDATGESRCHARRTTAGAAGRNTGACRAPPHAEGRSGGYRRGREGSGERLGTVADQLRHGRSQPRRRRVVRLLRQSEGNRLYDASGRTGKAGDGNCRVHPSGYEHTGAGL